METARDKEGCGLTSTTWQVSSPAAFASEDFNRPHNSHRFPTVFTVKEPEVASVQTPEPAPQRTLAAFAAEVNNRCCCHGCTGEGDAVHPHQREPLLHHPGTRPVTAIIPEPRLLPHATTLQAPAHSCSSTHVFRPLLGSCLVHTCISNTRATVTTG